MSADGRPDHGLLAEYAEGLLTGTPEGAAVEERLAADERWAAAYAEVRAALVAVGDDLAVFGAPEPIPADVAARVEAALARMGRPAAVPLRSRRRRYLAVASGVAAAAVAVAVGGGIITGAAGNHGGDAGSTVRATSAVPPSPGENPAPGEARTFGSAAAPGPLPTEVGGAQITSTGTDYAPAGRAGLPASAPARDHAAPVPVALRRLAEPAALARCLAAVRTVTGSVVRSADFARWRGAPALIVAAGQVLAVGPSCGIGDADVLSRVTGTP